MMNTTQRGINNILYELNKIDFWDISIQKISRALSLGLDGFAYAVFLKNEKELKLEHYEGLPKDTLLKKAKNTKVLLAFNFNAGNNTYKITIFTKNPVALTKKHRADIQNLLSILSKTLSMRQVSKERIIETQIINQLNLNVITTLDENKITKDLELAARKMLSNEKIFLFHVKNDKLVGSTKVLQIKYLPKNIQNQLFNVPRIFTIRKKKFEVFLDDTQFGSDTNELMIIPLTIKNKFRGFFVADIAKAKNSFALTRLKFLANQAALALERIDLFQALNRTLKESQGLQELTKIMLSSLDLSSFSNEILQRAQKLLGFKRILFSLYDPGKKCFRRITGIGISGKKLKEAKATFPPFEVISKLFNNRYRISNSYYIPAEFVSKIERKVRKYELYKMNTQRKRIGYLWDPNDIFISPIYSKDRELVALLSLDLPLSNLVPTIEQVKLLEAFGDFLGLAIENTQLFGRIEKLSNTDEMTGVYNYRFLREKTTSLIKSGASPISLIMIDMDNFKKYNDRFGHLYGDEILRIFSKCIMNVVGPNGYVIRYGGDEFIILLPQRDRKFSKRMMSKVNNYVNGHKIIRGKNPIKFSYGIALYPKNGRNLGDLIDHADRLLYQKKSKKSNDF